VPNKALKSYGGGEKELKKKKRKKVTALTINTTTQDFKERERYRRAGNKNRAVERQEL